ncbi:MAG: PIN domain-containing protein [Bifidobacteriaceae bacterium]|nr:PIN domain-containing protein [Bifidobacteriaceae bacterium]
MFRVVLDANALVPMALADTLMRAAERGLFVPLWSERIMGEARRAVLRVHPGLSPTQVDARLSAMRETFPEASVAGWEPLVATIELPDPLDRHVVAAAVRARADAIVTANLADFPERGLGPLGLHAVSPDTFLCDLLDLAPQVMARVIEDQAADAKNPPMSANDVVIALGLAGARDFAKAVARSAPTTTGFD